MQNKESLIWAQATPFEWYAWIDNYLHGFHFTKSEVDPNLYYTVVAVDPVILELYVDDFILTRSSRSVREIF